MSDGIYKAAEPFRCKKCRQWQSYGTMFVLYTGGDRPWYGCVPCAGVYLDMVRGAGHATNQDDDECQSSQD